MNHDLLKKLFIEAEYHSIDTSKPWPDEDYQTRFIPKFAELIVRECSQYIEDKFDFCGDEIIIAEKLLEHFGVEE